MGKPNTTTNIKKPTAWCILKTKGLRGSAVSGKTMKFMVSHTNNEYSNPFRYLFGDSFLTAGNNRKKKSVNEKEIK